jgi:hypothetical protein
MATIKKSLKKAQNGEKVKDNTRVAQKFDVSKQLKQEKVAKKNEKIDKELNKPYTAVAVPDRGGFSGDSIRYYPGQRSYLGIPYTRDMGLKGIAQVSAKDLREVSKDKKSARTYQDTTAVKANFEKDKNGGTMKKKMQTGGAVKKKMQTGGSIGSKVVKENPRQQKRLSRIKKNNPERAERVEKRMVKRADRAMGARGAASRMKSGGSVKKK